MAFDIEQILNGLQTNATQSSRDMEDALAELSKRLMGMRGEAGQARQQLREGIEAPAPQVDPIAQTLLRTMGLASETLTGQQGAFKESQQLIAGQQEQLNQRRAESLKELEQAYRDAAARADQMGDKETSLKMKVKVDKYIQDQANLAQMRRTVVENKLTTERDQVKDSREATLRKGLQQSELTWRTGQAALENQSQERIAYIQQGLDPSDPSGKTPLPVAKSQRFAAAKSLGFVDPSFRAQALEDVYTKSKKETGWGPNAKVSYDTDAIRVKLFDVPPSADLSLDPQTGVMTTAAEFWNAMDPKDPNKPLYPRDKKNPQLLAQPYRARLIAYLQRYYPSVQVNK